MARLTTRPLLRREAIIRYAGGWLKVAAHNPPEVSVYLWGRYEDDVSVALRAALTQGGCAIDVGANCGVLTMLLRSCVGPEGRVVAVDPSSVATRRVREQVDINGFENVDVVTAGLGSSGGQDRFFQAAVGIGALPTADRIHTTGAGAIVALQTLDQLVTELRVTRVDLIKLDTDGSEPAILRGAAELLRRDGPLIVLEAFAEGMRRRGHEPTELGNVLQSSGYALLRPVMAARRPWSAAPPRVRRFEDLPVRDLTRHADGVNLMAWRPADPHHQQIRSRLLGAAAPTAKATAPGDAS